MRTEHSAGAVLYTVVSGEPRYVLVTERSGYASLPKGHLEEGETPARAALREIREETGISATLTTAEPLWQDGYALRGGGFKRVDYFLARFDGQPPSAAARMWWRYPCCPIARRGSPWECRAAVGCWSRPMP